MDKMIHFPLFQPYDLVSSQTLLLAHTVEFSGCLLKLHFGCRVTGKGRFGIQRKYLARGCGWHITEPRELLLLLAPFLCSHGGTIFSPIFQFFGSAQSLHRLCPFHKPDHRGYSCVVTLSYSFWPSGRRMGIGHILKPFL